MVSKYLQEDSVVFFFLNRQDSKRPVECKGLLLREANRGETCRGKHQREALRSTPTQSEPPALPGLLDGLLFWHLHREVALKERVLTGCAAEPPLLCYLV